MSAKLSAQVRLAGPEIAKTRLKHSNLNSLRRKMEKFMRMNCWFSLSTVSNVFLRVKGGSIYLSRSGSILVSDNEDAGRHRQGGGVNPGRTTKQVGKMKITASYERNIVNLAVP